MTMKEFREAIAAHPEDQLWVLEMVNGDRIIRRVKAAKVAGAACVEIKEVVGVRHFGPISIVAMNPLTEREAEEITRRTEEALRYCLQNRVKKESAQ